MQNIDPTYENLLTKQLTGETLTPEEHSLLNKWINEKEEHQKLRDEFEWVWENTQSTIPNVNLDKAWDKVQNKIEPSPKGKFIHLNLFLKVAAVAIIISGLFFLLPGNQESIEWKGLATAEKMQTYELNDGSNIKLTPNTTISVDQSFGDQYRRVKLKGKAFFNVTRDEKKPFLIHSGKARIKVLGTSFVVEQKSNGTVEVIVKTGKVQVFNEDQDVKSPQKYILLEKGEKGYINTSKNQLKKEDYNLGSNELSWTNKKIKFHNSSVKEVIEKLERIYATQINVSNEGLLYCRITARINQSTIEETLEVLTSTFGWQYAKGKNSFVLSGESCKQ